MPIGTMRQAVFNDSNLQLFQDSINDQFSQVSKIPFMNGRMINQSLASGANVINHKLGRAIQGYLVTSKSANVNIYNGAMGGEATVTIYASGPATVGLWVF